MVLISFKIYDPSGFCDEVIRHCKRNKIISYGVQINWDALVFRIPYQIPDYLGVWGEQSFVFSSVYWDDNLASDKLVRSLDIIFNKNKRDVSDIGYL
jgi:hypothetical protein